MLETKRSSGINAEYGAHTEFGDIPCRAKGTTAWYPHHGVDHSTENFSHVNFYNWKFVSRSTLLDPPPNALACGTFKEVDNVEPVTLFAVVVHTSMGDLPGYVKRDDGVAWYGDGKNSHSTTEFSWIVRVFHKLVNNPSNQVPHIFEKDGSLVYLAVAHTTWGDIPCKVQDKTARFSHGAGEHTTTNFSYLEFPTWTLVRHVVKLPPPSALCLDDCHPVIVHTQHGDMIGKVKAGVAWYTYDGWDHTSTKFSWIVHAVALKLTTQLSTTTVKQDKPQTRVTETIKHTPLTILSSTSAITPATIIGPDSSAVVTKTEPVKVLPEQQVPGRPHQVIGEEIFVEHFSDGTIKTTITSTLVTTTTKQEGEKSIHTKMTRKTIRTIYHKTCAKKILSPLA
eukprot:TRINITY_DN3564_c0_g1_i2.p1 TRINITY_DN3564_c0_g1~~TRINITY_DN3564_c0_g1_i2.p1  ORF type:complete len:395 (-),score=113.44 TRINITY_DN3564_c0_g1_i2:120-1304(-)